MIANINFTSIDNYNTSLYENFQLEYELFLIESNAFSTLSKINTRSLQESGDIEILQESIKETLTVWITRFTEALQKNLNRFREVIEGQQDLAYLKSIEGNVKALDKDPGFGVSNIRNYNSDVIQKFDIKPFKAIYDTNKESLQNQEQFLIKNYGNYGFTEGQTDIKEVLENAIVDVVKDEVIVTAELIRGYYNWCRNDYKNDLETVTKMMNTYNESAKAITDLIRSLPDDYRNNMQTTDNPNVTQNNNNVNTEIKEESFQFAPLFEAETDAPTNAAAGTPNNQTNNPSKMEFNDKTDYINKQMGSKGASNQEAVTAVKTYLSVTTRIVSTLFMIVKNRKADYMRVLKHLFPMNKEQQQAAQATTTINTNTTNAPQVK